MGVRVVAEAFMGWGRGQVPVWWTPRIRIQCESGASGRMPKQARAPRPPAFSVPQLGHPLTATQSFRLLPVPPSSSPSPKASTTPYWKATCYAHTDGRFALKKSHIYSRSASTRHTTRSRFFTRSIHRRRSQRHTLRAHGPLRPSNSRRLLRDRRGHSYSPPCLP